MAHLFQEATLNFDITCGKTHHWPLQKRMKGDMMTESGNKWEKVV